MYLTGIHSNSLNTLKKIAQTKLVDNYYLAGGTACALHLNHRISYDLDFFSIKPLDPVEIRNILINMGELEIFQNDQGTFNGQLDSTKISFFIYPYEQLDNPIKFEDVNVCSLRDLACMKLEVISSRGAKRDFVDLFQISHSYSLYEMLGWFRQKYQGQNVSIPHVLKSLVYFADAEVDPDPNMTIEYNWEEIKAFFIDAVPTVARQLEIA